MAPDRSGQVDLCAWRDRDGSPQRVVRRRVLPVIETYELHQTTIRKDFLLKGGWSYLASHVRGYLHAEGLVDCWVAELKADRYPTMHHSACIFISEDAPTLYLKITARRKPHGEA